MLYQAQGRYADAEPLYKRALTIREKALGPDHPNVAVSLNNLAGLYQTQGRYAEAEPLYKQSLAINEEALGSDHPNTALSLNNLAELYHLQGRYGDALPFVKRTISQNSANKSIAFPILYGSENQKLITPKEALNASYTVLQRSISTAAGEAVSKLAARFAAGTNELAQLVRRDQDLTAEAGRLDKSIITAVSKPPTERNASMEDQIRKRIDEIKLERDKLQDLFNQRFPDYVALSRPQPLAHPDLKGVRTLCRRLPRGRSRHGHGQGAARGGHRFHVAASMDKAARPYALPSIGFTPSTSATSSRRPVFVWLRRLLLNADRARRGAGEIRQR